MKTISIAGTDYQVDEAVADAFEQSKVKGDRADALSAELTRTKTQLTVLEAQAAQAAPEQKQDAIEKEVQARFDAYSAASPFLDGVAFDAGKSAEAWMTDALTASYPEMQLDGLDIHTAFQMLVAQGAPERNTAQEFITSVHGDRSTARQSVTQQKSDEEMLRDAHQQEIAALRTAHIDYWKQGA